MTHGLEVPTRHRPVLDPGFLPAVLWNRAYRERVRATRDAVDLGIALVRQDGTAFTHKARILPQIYEFLDLPYKAEYEQAIRVSSLKKSSKANKREQDTVEQLCMPVYKQLREFVTLS